MGAIFWLLIDFSLAKESHGNMRLLHYSSVLDPSRAFRGSRCSVAVGRSPSGFPMSKSQCQHDSYRGALTLRLTLPVVL